MEQMEDNGIERKVISGSESLPLLRRVKGFDQLKPDDLSCLGRVEVFTLSPNFTCEIFDKDPEEASFWLLVEGRVELIKQDSDGARSVAAVLTDGESFGEVTLLSGLKSALVSCSALKDSLVLRICLEDFWRLMGTCPTVRRTVLQNMSHRLSSINTLQIQREKLVSLGMLAAGLMHELNNPGSAARRAAVQLRESLQTLPEVCLQLSQLSLNGEQLACMTELQKEILSHVGQQPTHSLEESDAQEDLTQWLEAMGVEQAWTLAQTLVLAGWRRKDLECAKGTFQDEMLAQILLWLQGLVASMQSVATIEESLTRVTDLVLAVKCYSYEDKNTLHLVDIHKGLKSTLAILGHKLRYKQLQVETQFDPELPSIETCGRGLNQVWTNLLDNAIDAAPEGSTIRVRSWREENRVSVSIEDSGDGIPEQVQKHIFEPFYTTKPLGIGTGLGLDIAHRIITEQYHGEISFTSRPGQTVFFLHLPIKL